MSKVWVRSMLGTVWEKSVLDSTAYVNSVVGT